MVRGAKRRITMEANESPFTLFKYTGAVVEHKTGSLIDKMIELQGFFNKIIVRFSFINIFALC